MSQIAAVPATQMALPADPFAPVSPEIWNLKWACHLLRRAAFGPSHDRLDAILKLTPQQAVESLFDFDPEKDAFGGMIDQLEGFVRFNEARSVAEWWVFRMINSPWPFQERMALVWHNHFATSAAKVENGRLMHQQIELFRKLGTGNFRDLLLAVGRDPAMLIWLDGQSNRKGKPNENYGWEVMELFTIGVGQYSETDVKELARAFTGWRTDGNQGVFAKPYFDDGEKTIFGRKGKFDSESAVDLLLAHPAAPKFIAVKLLRAFVHPEPQASHIDHYAKRLIDEKWSIKNVLQEMLTSRLFFSDWAYRSRIKSPVDLCIGAIHAIDGGGGKVNTNFVREALSRMGQNLLYPPNVKGWDGEQVWINANTVLVRFNFGLSLATQRGREFSHKTEFTTWLKKHDIKSADDVIDYFARVLMDGRIDEPMRQKLLTYMNTGENGKTKTFELSDGSVNTKGKGVLHLMMSTPEYQLS